MLRQPAVAQLVFRIHPYLFYTTLSYIWASPIIRHCRLLFYFSYFIFLRATSQSLGNFLRRRLLFIFRKAELHQVELYGEVTTTYIS